MVNKFSKRIVYILCLITLLIVFICSLLTVNNVSFVVNLYEYIPLYLLVFVVLSLLLYLFIKISKRINTKYIYILYITLIFLMPLMLYKLSVATVVADGKEVMDFTFETLKGNYQGVFKGSYMSCFPYQFGLSLLWTVILKTVSLFNSNVIYEYSSCINIISLVQSIISSISLLFGLKIVKKLSHNNETAKLSYVFLSLTCIPFFMYSLYLYNDVPAICFSMISTYFFVKYIQNSKIYDFLLSILFIGIAMILRFSTVIFAIAFMLVIVYQSIFETKKYLKILLALLFVVLPVLMNKLPYKHYESISNYNHMVNPEEYSIEDGQPVLLTIAMGTDINMNLYGWWSGTSWHTYIDVCGMDSTCAIEKAKEQISSSLDTMSSNPQKTIDFFYNKMASQWGDGTMGSLFETNKISDTVDRSIVNFIYKGTSNIMINCYAKGHLILVCFLSLLSIIKKRHTNEISMLDLTFEIIILGGFILSMFWETRCRYNLPYFYLLTIIAALYFPNFSIKNIRSLNL